MVDLINIPSLEESVRLRIDGKIDPKFLDGNCVRETGLYVSKQGIYLTKIPLIIDNIQKVIAKHEVGRDYYLTDEQV